MEHTIPIEISILFILVFILTYTLKKIGIPAIITFLMAGFLGKIWIDSSHIDNLYIFKELGIILLFFFIGLEFSFDRLKGMLNTFMPAMVDLLFNLAIPFIFLTLLGFDYLSAFIIASVIYPSSTSIVAKLLVDYRRLVNPEAELLLGILIFEDIIAIVILTFLSYLSSGSEPSLLSVGLSLLKMSLILIGFFLLYKFVLSKLTNIMDKVSEDENFIFLVLGVVLLFGSFFKMQGISEALGAFLIGVAIPQTKIAHNIEQHLSSLKELSIGIFFFFFTYDIDFQLPENKFLLLLLIVLSILLKGVSTYIGAYIYGLKRKARLRASLSFLSRGEFSVIISALNPLYSGITVPLILVTAIIGTLLFAVAGDIANFIYRSKQRTS